MLVHLELTVDSLVPFTLVDAHLFWPDWLLARLLDSFGRSQLGQWTTFLLGRIAEWTSGWLHSFDMDAIARPGSLTLQTLAAFTQTVISSLPLFRLTIQSGPITGSTFR